MVTDLVQIGLLGEKKRPENERFRRHMKSHDHSDRILRRIAEGIEEGIDSTQCANCCKVATAKGLESRRGTAGALPADQAGAIPGGLHHRERRRGRDPALHGRARLRVSERHDVHGVRRTSRELPALSACGSRGRVHRQPHVAVRGPRVLLPHSLQLAGSP